MALYKKVQNQSVGTKASGKWYLKPIVLMTANTDLVAERVQKNASVKISDVKAVLHELKDVLQDLLAEGYRIKLEGIGTFKPSLSSSGAETPEECTVAACLKKTKVLFQAEAYRDGSTGKLVRPLASKIHWVQTVDYQLPTTEEDEPTPEP